MNPQGLFTSYIKDLSGIPLRFIFLLEGIRASLRAPHSFFQSFFKERLFIYFLYLFMGVKNEPPLGSEMNPLPLVKNEEI